MHPQAQQLIDRLDLQPHPEGGYFREVYRTDLQVHSSAVEQSRAALTDIYFLLPAGQVSRWHRVAHTELWNFYAGAPLQLHQLSPDFSNYSSRLLDPQVVQFKHLVPAGYWQAAETEGEFSLVGCSVAPGFDFNDFCLLKELPESAAIVYSKYPELAHLF